MSEKKYTPYEAALEVLKKAQEVYNKHKELDKCGEISKEEDLINQAVNNIMGDKHGVDDIMSKLPKEKRAKVLAALRNKDAKKAEMCKGWMDKAEDLDKCGDIKTVGKKEKKEEDLEKFVASGSMAPGSVASTGGPSIGSQIGFGKSDKKEYSGKVGDVDPKIISDMKSKLSDAKKDKKLPEFLKKKKMKKANAGGSEDIAAPKAPKAGSPQPPSISGDQGWSNAKKSEEEK